MTGSVVISNLLYVVGAAVLAFIGGVIVVRRYRKPTSIEANVATFSRGLRALAPDAGNGAKSNVARQVHPAPAVSPQLTDRVKVVGGEQRGAQVGQPQSPETEAEAG